MILWSAFGCATLKLYSAKHGTVQCSASLAEKEQLEELMDALTISSANLFSITPTPSRVCVEWDI